MRHEKPRQAAIYGKFLMIGSYSTSRLLDQRLRHPNATTQKCINARQHTIPPMNKGGWVQYSPHSHASLTPPLTPFLANQSTEKLPAHLRSYTISIAKNVVSTSHTSRPYILNYNRITRSTLYYPTPLYKGSF
jgi:hypothetical protein